MDNHGKYNFNLIYNEEDVRRGENGHTKILQRIKPGTTILECGPADGIMTRYLKEKLHCNVYIVEIDAEAFAHASNWADGGVCADLESDEWISELYDESFDYILFADVLEHLRDPIRMLQKTKRLLKRNGSVLMSIPNNSHGDIIANLMCDTFTYTPLGLLDNTHIHLFARNSIHEMIHSVGFYLAEETCTRAPLFSTEQSEFIPEEQREQLKMVVAGRPSAYVYQYICRLVLFETKTISDVDDYDITDKTLKNVLDEKDAAIATSQSECIQAQRTNTQLQEKHIQLQEKHIQLQETYSNLQNEIIVLQDKHSQLQWDYEKSQNAHAQAQQQVKNTQDMLTQAQKQHFEVQVALEQLQQQSENANLTFTQIQDSHIQLKNEFDVLQNNYMQVQNDYLNSNTALAQTQQQLVAAQAAYAAISNATFWRITAPLRRFTNCVKRVLHRYKATQLLCKGVRCLQYHGVRYTWDKVCKKFSKKKNQPRSYLCGQVDELINTAQKNPFYPLVTVAIPIYDRTDVLIESIDSILNQSYPNIEIIAVCDGSPQKTLDIVKRYEKENKIRAFYYKDNSGNAVRGRNRAIMEAKGEYLAFQDSDDIADKDRIKTSVEWMNNYNADVVYGGWRALNDGSRNIDIKDGLEVMSPDCDLDMLMQHCVPCQSTVMVRLSALKRVGGLKTSMRYREDHELWLRLAYYGYRFKSIPHVLTNLRLHAGNLELSFKEDDSIWVDRMLKEYKIIEQPKPKIAYLIPGCGISGGIAVICQHVNRLQRRGYDVLLITEDDQTSISWFPRQRVKIIPLAEAPDDLDVLVCTGWSTAYTAQHIPAKKKYYFVQSNEIRFFDESDIENRKKVEDTYRMPYTCITEAKWIQQWLKETFNQEAVYVPNGVDERIIYQVKYNTPPRKRIRVLLEGPIDIPYKGMADAFAAVQDLDCEVWCISSAGKPKPKWHCDRFFERVCHDEMRYIYSACDILVKMSRVEGFFGPPMEMMACGGACVVGKVTGYDEYIIDGVNALVVDEGDVNGARNAINSLIKNDALRNKLIAAGKETVKQWTWEPSIDSLEELYGK